MKTCENIQIYRNILIYMHKLTALIRDAHTISTYKTDPVHITQSYTLNTYLHDFDA